MLKKLLIFLLFLFSFINFSEIVKAETFFEDDFSYQDNSKWIYENGDGSINFNDGYVELNSTGLHFPLILNKQNVFSYGENVSLEVKFMFSNRNTMGDGIGVGFTNTSGYPFYQFAVWNGSNHGPLFISRNFNNSFYNYCDLSNATDDSHELSVDRISLGDNIWHTLTIEKTQNSFKVFIDKDANPDPLLSTSNNWCIPSVLFLGNPLTGGSYTWTSLKIDYLKISNGEEGKRKVVVLPGMGASWNERAMVLNETISANDWKMTPFVKNYDSLISGMEQNGLVKNKDFYVWNYDWRKPVANIVSDFNQYLLTIGVGGSEKVDLVGHSLGGLVARIWSQENSNRINQVITLGSPHSGSVKAYEAWNGAKVADEFNLQSIALNVLLQLQKKNNKTLVETIQNYSPSLKDLLPTFSYLKMNGSEISPPQNLYLKSKNQTIGDIFSKFIAVVGRGKNTKEWINLGERTVFDKVLGLWEKGKPISYSYGDGDGTVLKKSAKFDGDTFEEKISDHGNLPNNSVNLVLQKLGLGITIVETANDNLPKAVFYIGSPANMIVNCGSGETIVDTDGWVVVPNKKAEDCSIKLIGRENGTYHLVMGNSNSDEGWYYVEDEIQIGSEKNISLKDRDFWYRELNNKTLDLLNQFSGNKNLLSLKTAIDAKNIDNALVAYLNFRKEKKETNITGSMIQELEKILSIEKIMTAKEIETKRILALSYKNIADKTALLLQKMRINPTIWQALNYVQAETLMKTPGYANYLLAGKLYEIVWK
jgi:pimeloyl-ACP methyl ester carboxylesterase